MEDQLAAVTDDASKHAGRLPIGPDDNDNRLARDIRATLDFPHLSTGETSLESADDDFRRRAILHVTLDIDHSSRAIRPLPVQRDDETSPATPAVSGHPFSQTRCLCRLSIG